MRLIYPSPDEGELADAIRTSYIQVLTHPNREGGSCSGGGAAARPQGLDRNRGVGTTGRAARQGSWRQLRRRGRAGGKGRPGNGRF